MAKDRLRVVSLGGVGEVGKNSHVIEYRHDMIIIDAGVKFPEEEMHGIDLVIPDFSYVVSQSDRLRGILLTHGHEDHIGAIPYLLPQLPGRVPIYGSDLALGLLRAKLQEAGVAKMADLHEMKPGESIDLGSMQAKFFDVNHSVPGSFGVELNTPVGTLLHTGDFKFSEPGTPQAAKLIEELAAMGRRGVLVLMSDCVRVEQPGRTPPESVVGEALEKIFSNAPGRVIVTTFASNIVRWQQAIRISASQGRNVAVAGRSLGGSLDAASELGYVQIPMGTIISLEEARKLPVANVTLLVTGSQGEPSSVLSRMAADDYRPVKLVEGDTVIFAASPVPGNETTVTRTIDNLFRHGANVLYPAIAENIHVSGHASRDELKQMIALTRPEFAIPVHGDYRHMVLYQTMAQEVGLTAQQVLLPEQGEVLGFVPGSVETVEEVPTGSVLVDGITVGKVTQVVLRDRHRLAEDGVLIASMAIDRETGELLSGPDLVSRGFVHPEDGEVLEDAREDLRRSLHRKSRGQAEYGYIMSKVSDVLGAHIYRNMRRRPLILPVVTEV